MENLTVFNNEQFGEIRTVQKDGGPWFVAADVCRALEIKDTYSAVSRLDDEEKGTDSISTPGGMQIMSIVNEYGLYGLVFGSRKKEAEEFKRWIRREVLPSIRKTGGYQAKPMTQAEITLANAQAIVDHERRMEAIEASQKVLADKLDKAAEAFTAPSYSADTWQENARATIAAIVQSDGLSYQAYTGELYQRLESMAGVNLKSRQSFKQKRMKEAGARYKERQAVTKLNVIADDSKLRLVFDHILAMEKAKRLLNGGAIA